ncbi:efflux RND transporter periplasmic adaptor subunit [Eoetvoesiella caeni]|uniref:Membrane fusion protein (Multidrug efflux system) n=1 Tax=Eoetvoesiella caeni TaxID=645616 RepID=A0A366HJD9_9BURK|nr:efflux RND transporter periplasmic adaptor subunit [Eoetvoesiella caeni]MCI2807522.1 efflux RND transporter periplasmic adaptor subunit [Eoetvoesiella caeni]NYT53083.1 efflux RND transporter periplasmic adaptor subunit [Eoetvoesiella caeni]RBP43060.1 membrane fusion protein (multidrug efflux system) [Eoetvoesiella caeni]
MHSFGLSARRQALMVAVVCTAMLAACGKKPQQNMGDMKVPVSVITVQPMRTDVYAQLPGRVEAIKDAQIRARVSGIVTDINFKQGSEVKDGQLLFTIDPAPYRAVRDQAAAQLKRAQADAQSARLLAQRYAKLIDARAVSRQDYDNAMSASAQAQAAVAAAKATLQSAEIDLGYTKVVSPISGRIGKSLVTEGALVSATSATQLATVQQIDRVYVDLTRSTTELAQLRKALASGVLEQTPGGAAKVHVLLEDGSRYSEEGQLLFSGITVDPTTGQVNLRAEFANKNEILLPGMYVRVQLQQGIDEKALLVPQQAVQRTADGRSSLMLVKDGKATPSPVTVGAEIDGKYIITSGLAAGDVVVVEGFQKIRPGAAVQGMPWKEPGQPGAGAPAGGGQPASAQPGAAKPDAAKPEAAKPAAGDGANSAAKP